DGTRDFHVTGVQTCALPIYNNYLPKLDAITKDIEAARRKTNELLKAENRPDQRRALEANRESQKLAEEAAKGYRRYLLQQREQRSEEHTSELQSRENLVCRL